MTLPEIAVALDGDLDKKRPMSGGKEMTAEELAAYVKWRRNLTARQMLDLARKDELKPR